MKKSNLIFIAIIVFLLIVCSLCLIFMNKVPLNNLYATVYVDGKVYEKINLSDDNLFKEYTIKTEYGKNVLYVSEKGVCVIEADCPDGTCIKTGFTNNPHKPIICMPHRLEIIINGESVDGISR